MLFLCWFKCTLLPRINKELLLYYYYNDNQNTDPENDLGGCKNATAEKKCEYKPKKSKETIEH